jgi:hypothetical protein
MHERSRRICCRHRGGEVNLQAAEAAAVQIRCQLAKCAAGTAAEQRRQRLHGQPQHHWDLAGWQLPHSRRQGSLELAAAHHCNRCFRRVALWQLAEGGGEGAEQDLQLAQLCERAHQAAGDVGGHVPTVAGRRWRCGGAQQQGPQGGQVLLDGTVLHRQDPAQHGQRRLQQAGTHATLLLALPQLQGPVGQALQQGALLAARILRGAVQLLLLQRSRQQGHTSVAGGWRKGLINSTMSPG